MKKSIILSIVLLFLGCGSRDASQIPVKLPVKIEFEEKQMNARYNKYLNLEGGIQLNLLSENPIFIKKGESTHCKIISGVLENGDEVSINYEFTETASLEVMTPWLLVYPKTSNAIESLCILPVLIPTKNTKNLKSAKVLVTARITFCELGSIEFQNMVISKEMTYNIK